MHFTHKLAGGSSGGGSIVGFDSALQMEMPRTTRNSGVETSSVHRHHHHQHGESTDMRQPGAENNQIGSTTMNPISTESGSAAAGGGGGGGSQAEAAAAGQLQPPPSSSSSPDYDAQQQQQQRALEQLCFYRALFAEGAPDCCGGGDFPRPPGTTTGATVAAQAYYFLVRVAMVVALGLFVYFFILYPQAILRYAVFLPSILATLACLAATFVLPSKFKAAADEIGAAAITTTPRPAAAEAAEAAVGTSPDDNDDDDESRRARRRLLDLEGINWAGRRALIFTATWLVIGVGGSIYFAVGHTEKYGLARGAQSFIVNLFMTCATLPTLGAIFFVLALDVARIKKEIATLEEGALDRSLTLEAYQRSQGYIEGISGGTKRSLAAVAAIALYNVAGLVAFVYYNSEGALGDYDEAFEILSDFIYFAVLAKEACLFFAFAYLAVVVNDAADDVCTEVYLWPAAAASDDEEAAAGGSNDVDIRRLKIIAQATTFVGPKQRKHRGDSWGRLAASHAGGISFKVLGVRWTSAYFATLLVSSGASLLSGLAQRYK